MDSGYLEEGETMQDDYDFSKALLPEEIIGIIDQLLCHEVRGPILSKVKYLISSDGLAHGLPPLPNHFHQPLHRQAFDANANESGTDIF
jgi:Mak10 subunit, NatC N(alpha)-terminal acetyltransferase